MISALSPQLVPESYRCISIVETPRHSRCKYSYDEATGLFHLSFVLPEGLIFPFDFGFIPSTLSGDGDPLDVLILLDAPAAVGVVVEIRLLGVIKAVQAEDGKKARNDRLLAAAVQSHEYQHVKTIDDLPPSMLNQIEQFFVAYTRLQGRSFTLEGAGGRKAALRAVKKAMAAFEAEHEKAQRKAVGRISEPPRKTHRTRGK